ncbi:MAG: RlmE family RNA methyltransferase [Rhodospirillales bacterium]|nr:RlmE family RNA methyltransferase [Rhodospirillales bacterium]
MSRTGPKTRVKTARGRKTSSKQWLERQLNDPYVRRAQADGMRSRAAYKLLEIDQKTSLLRPGLRVVDLGAAPGGWSQVAAARGCRIVAIDLLAMDPLPGVDFIQMDFMEESAPEVLSAALGGPADLVLSDMAPNTTGHKATDHLRIMALVEAAADFAGQVLAPGGAFVAKVFQGGAEHTLLADLKRAFAKVQHIKPPASRKESAEQYLVATGFRGMPKT